MMAGRPDDGRARKGEDSRPDGRGSPEKALKNLTLESFI